MEFGKLTREQQELVRMNRMEAGVENTVINEPVNTATENNFSNFKNVENETNNATVETAEIVAEDNTPQAIKERKNEATRRKIKQQGGLRPNATFTYTLIDWDGNLKEVLIKYPSTRQAMKYQKIGIDGITGKAFITLNEIVEEFANDNLFSSKFDIDDFHVNEVTELAAFLGEVVRNPRLQ